MRTRLAVAFLLATVAGSLSGQYPAATWPARTPAAAGMNGKVIDSISAEIARGDYGQVDRLLVIRSGAMVFDKRYEHDYDAIYGAAGKVPSPLASGDLTGPYNYYNPWWHPYYRRGDLHTLQSVTKTVTSIVIGTAIAKGDFPSIDTPVLSFFDTTAVANIDDRKRRMTVRHLLTMTGGFAWNEGLPYTDPANNAVVMEASHDWVGYVINLPMGTEPGSRWNYSSGESELLAHIFHTATGSDIEEYAARNLFGPVGIERWYWKRTPTGLVDTEGGLYLEAGDLARLWYLFTRDGMWNGRRIVSSEWVKESVKPAVRVGDRAGAPYYGFKWWLRRDPSDTTKFLWAGSGFGGQFPVALPEQDMVVVFNGWAILPGEKRPPIDRLLARLQLAVLPRKK